MVNNDLTKESKIVITGGHGFLGHHVLSKLTDAGYQNIYRPRAEMYDFRRQNEVESMLMRLEPDVVIHLAATVGGIGENKRRPADFLYDNLTMGLESMRASQHYGVRKFIQIGSACSYPKNAPSPIHEDDLWHGYPEDTSAPYGVAKRVLLTYAQALRDQYGFNVVYLIPTNMYGPGDNFNPETSHVIPAVISKIQNAIDNNQPAVTLWGTGNATRDFLYVEDCAEAIVKAMEIYDEPEPINLATGQEISIDDLASLIAYEMGYRGRIEFDATKPDGQPQRRLDTSRAQKLLDFRAKTGIIPGLEKTIKFYRRQK